MKTVDDFVELLSDEIGLAVTVHDLDSSFDQVPGWDSVHLLTLMMLLERRTGRPVSLPAMLEAPSLGHIYQLATRP